MRRGLKRMTAVVGLLTAGGLFVGEALAQTQDIPPVDFDGGDELDVPLPIDYSVVRYTNSNMLPPEDWYQTWDYAGGQDYSADIVTQQVGLDTHVWITGEGRSGTRRDVFTVHYLDDGTGPGTPDWSHGFNAAGFTTYNYGKAITVQGNASIKMPYITGAVGYTNNDWMLALKYQPNPGIPPPLYTKHWNKLYSNGAFDEGRAVVVQVVDGTSANFSTFIAGTSSLTGEGREFAVWRYRE